VKILIYKFNERGNSMDIHFNSPDIELTSALKSSAEEKIKRLEHLDANITTVNITMRVENVTHIAEATIPLRGSDLHATAKGNDMYNAIDELTDKLKTLIIKHKEKQTDHHR
jgi:putative sigma-54 modulation protein